MLRAIPMRAIAGITIAVLGAVMVGFLEIRRIGAEDGAVFDINNVVVGITNPVTPIWQMLGLAAGGVLMFIFIAWDIRGHIKQGACVGTVALLLGLIVLLAYVGISTDYVELLGQPPLHGLEGWLVKAGYHPIIHTVAVFALVAPLTVRQLKNRTGSEYSSLLDQD